MQKIGLDVPKFAAGQQYLKMSGVRRENWISSNHPSQLTLGGSGGGHRLTTAKSCSKLSAVLSLDFSPVHEALIEESV